MKGLLIDENLPLPTALPTELPIIHVRDLGVQLSDDDIWEHATREDFVIVTKDTDFIRMIDQFGSPPVVVHVRVGNLRRSEFITWFYRIWPQIEKDLEGAKLINVHFDHLDIIS